jgi:hypothetical protein
VGGQLTGSGSAGEQQVNAMAQWCMAGETLVGRPPYREPVEALAGGAVDEPLDACAAARGWPRWPGPRRRCARTPRPGALAHLDRLDLTALGG